MPVNRKPKARSSASKRNDKEHTAAKLAAKKKRHHLPKDQSESIRDALNRDTHLLYYNALENLSVAPPSTPQADSVAALADSMRGLGE